MLHFSEALPNFKVRSLFRRLSKVGLTRTKNSSSWPFEKKKQVGHPRQANFRDGISSVLMNAIWKGKGEKWESEKTERRKIWEREKCERGE